MLGLRTVTEIDNEESCPLFVDDRNGDKTLIHLSKITNTLSHRQNWGYLRPCGMLFTTKAIPSIMTAPAPVGKSTYKYPKL